MKHSFVKIGTFLICMILLQGCGAAQQEITSSGCSFGNGAGNYADTFFCYRTQDKQTALLDYDSMKTTLLCSKPNCTHNGEDCIVKRLNGTVPVFGDKCAYYFVDGEPVIEQDQEGKADLELKSALYRYDFGSDSEKMLLQIDGACVGNNCKGMMLEQDKLYFVENKLGRSYDENGSLMSYRSQGGDHALYSVQLSDLKTEHLCDLYDVEALTAHFPLAGNSGSVTMVGKFENKLYFNVVFSLDETGGEPGYYVTYYDLADGSYHGTPSDYTNIEYGKVTFLSDDYLVICSDDGKAEVHKKGSDTPVQLEDEFYFNYFCETFADQDTLFCFDKAFDLNTKEVRMLKALKDEQHVIARYGDSYILSNRSLPGEFEKISAKKLLN